VAKGRQSVTITSNTAELITAVHFSDGQAVSKGQVLVELKGDQEDAGIAQAQAQLAQADREYQRWKILAEKGIAPRASADQYLAARDTARAALASASAQKLDKVIRAPFSGRVGISDIAPGALISPGTPIVSLDDVSLDPRRFLRARSLPADPARRPDHHRQAGRPARRDVRRPHRPDRHPHRSRHARAQGPGRVSQRRRTPQARHADQGRHRSGSSTRAWPCRNPPCSSKAPGLGVPDRPGIPRARSPAAPRCRPACRATAMSRSSRA
jgi:multidrug efflux pump subunit AcrA (membrane-fusion protein)